MATPKPLLHPISTLRLLIIFLSLLSISSANAVDPQLTALLDVAKAIGHPMNLTRSWQGDDFCHNWEFITCTPDRNVTIINFEQQNLSGTISPAFANLTSLTTLRLNDNNLTGPIPDVLATLPRLEFLDVSNNNLSGKVPVFPSTVKFMASGNHLLLGHSAGSGEKSNGSYSSAYSIALVVLDVVALLEIVGAVLILSYIVKTQHQRSKVIYGLAVADLVDVGVLLQRCSGENTVLMVTAAVALLVFVGAELLVSYNKKKQPQKSGWINTVLMVIAKMAFLVYIGVMLWLACDGLFLPWWGIKK
ncbi:hypothetical protein Vadar_006079 [Vaccinium darrowii]|uniref:Uncharacterized protein n=1 Tax=Vaccinium darrowii TaxID=229202 RepID=A0ACB7Z1Y8_9ERIC|nr:hypothetical protein Vadar_006079 [Vaccinium darrowii]